MLIREESKINLAGGDENHNQKPVRIGFSWVMIHLHLTLVHN